MSNINVTTSGPDAAGNDLVNNIINRALINEGFLNVALVNNVGEPAPANDVPSLMDQITSNNPGFFTTPVRIWTQSAHASPEEEQAQALDQSLATEAQ